MEPDITAIIRIPPGRVVEDFWSWKLERLGHFSVRSAYKLLVQVRRQIEQLEGSGGNEKLFWKKLWRLAAPPKVRSLW